jgi:hypothetical protein
MKKVAYEDFVANNTKWMSRFILENSSSLASKDF